MTEPVEPSRKIKRLPLEQKHDLKHKNEARAVLKLRPIEIKVRTCLACGFLFESIANRTCGCTRGK